MEDRAGKLSLQPEALGADQEATNCCRVQVSLDIVRVLPGNRRIDERLGAGFGEDTSLRRSDLRS